MNKLDKIESATYNMIGENWNPGDTSASQINYSFVKEYNNPSDTTIGAKFVLLNKADTLKPVFCYDGQMRALFNNDKKGIIIDSFTVRKLPFRALTPPFFNYVTNIVTYALTSQGSISLEMKEQKNDIYVRLTINEDKQVEFFGKAYHIPTPPFDIGDPTSIYELWIDKKTDLPYKVRREMSHNISVTTCQDTEFNKLDIKDFKASDYFLSDYEIRPYGYRQADNKKNALINHKASTWRLQTVNNQYVSLSDFKSKVLMIQFTSVSCGPCKASIPFLKELHKDYRIADFDFVAIESTSNNTNVLKNYMERNKFDYKFLLSTKDVLKDYSIKSYPVFFILDENRVVKEVINGYGKGTTDNKIRTVIDELIN
ncbi:MAG: TlpA family protein disulfide reductase [Bacteroidales bacterium]|nr:TlpA family protein disulfide reductase [Bacteroidales bacterium]